MNEPLHTQVHNDVTPPRAVAVIAREPCQWGTYRLIERGWAVTRERGFRLALAFLAGGGLGLLAGYLLMTVAVSVGALWGDIEASAHLFLGMPGPRGLAGSIGLMFSVWVAGASMLQFRVATGERTPAAAKRETRLPRWVCRLERARLAGILLCLTAIPPAGLALLAFLLLPDSPLSVAGVAVIVTVAGALLYGRLMHAPALYVAYGIPVRQALRESARLTIRGRGFLLVGLGGVLGLATVLLSTGAVFRLTGSGTVGALWLLGTGVTLGPLWGGLWVATWEATAEAPGPALRAQNAQMPGKRASRRVVVIRDSSPAAPTRGTELVLHPELPESPPRREGTPIRVRDLVRQTLATVRAHWQQLWAWWIVSAMVIFAWVTIGMIAVSVGFFAMELSVIEQRGVALIVLVVLTGLAVGLALPGWVGFFCVIAVIVRRRQKTREGELRGRGGWKGFPVHLAGSGLAYLLVIVPLALALGMAAYLWMRLPWTALPAIGLSLAVSLYALTRLGYFPLLILEDRGHPWRSLRRSLRLTHAHQAPLLLLNLGFGAVAILALVLSRVLKSLGEGGLGNALLVLVFLGLPPLLAAGWVTAFSMTRPAAFASPRQPRTEGIPSPGPDR